jgi:hypothetical protein
MTSVTRIYGGLTREELDDKRQRNAAWGELASKFNSPSWTPESVESDANDAQGGLKCPIDPSKVKTQCGRDPESLELDTKAKYQALE